MGPFYEWDEVHLKSILWSRIWVSVPVEGSWIGSILAVFLKDRLKNNFYLKNIFNTVFLKV